MDSKPNKIVKKRLAELKPHPQQAALFTPLSPVELQALTLVQATQVAALPAKAQQKIAAGLEEGKRLQDLLATPGPASRRAGKTPESTFDRLLRQLTQVTDQLDQVTLPDVFAVADRKAFNRCRGVLCDLHEQLVDLPESITAMPASQARSPGNRS